MPLSPRTVLYATVSQNSSGGGSYPRPAPPPAAARVRSCDRILLVFREIACSDLLMVGGCWPSMEFGNLVFKCD